MKQFHYNQITIYDFFQFNCKQIDDLTMAMFEDADRFNRGAITYEALKSQLEKHGGLLENLSIR